MTVGVVTLPFMYEGPSRRKTQSGLEELRKHVDTIIVVPNQNLLKSLVSKLHLRVFQYQMMFCFMAYKVLQSNGKTGLMGDFADVETVGVQWVKL